MLRPSDDRWAGWVQTLRRIRDCLAREWASLVLLVACAIQVMYLLRGPTLGLAAQLWSRRQSSAMDRSAYFAFGDEFAGYMDFLREHVPEDALVIIPPVLINDVLGNQGMAQYFLFPRRVANCSPSIRLDTCISALGGSNTYILAVPGFPPAEAASSVKDYLRYDDSLGVYLPKAEAP